MSFQLMKSENDWHTYMTSVQHELGTERQLLSAPAGPQQYPCLVAHVLVEGSGEVAEAVYAFVYTHEALQLIEAQDPELLHNNLIKLGALEAAEAMQKGYKDADGPSRWISTKLRDNLLQFLGELRVMIPATLANSPETVEKGIDCVMLLEACVIRAHREGHLEVEESDLMEHVSRLQQLEFRGQLDSVAQDKFDMLTEQIRTGVRLLFNTPEPGYRATKPQYSEEGPAVEDWRQWVSAALLALGEHQQGAESFSRYLQQNIHRIEQDRAAKVRELRNEQI